MFGLAQESFTQNPICRQNNCVNPAFPGLNDLVRLEQVLWQCTENTAISEHLDFCSGVVNYNPGLPSPNESTPVGNLVKAQDDAASTMFFYHLSAMGYDAWDYRNPSAITDPCIGSVRRMVCFTYFPKVQAGCQAGQQTPYYRPCRDSCEEYINTCNVECCDEGLQCVFDHSVDPGGGGAIMTQTGYANYAGPSAQCTGQAMSAGRGLTAPLALLLAIFGVHAQAGLGGPEGAAPAADERPRRTSGRGLMQYALYGVLALVAVMIQGCDIDVPRHSVANWRNKPDYLVSYEFIPLGQPVANSTLNSCMDASARTTQCSGHGYCQAWSTTSTSANPVSFCLCDRDYADPECRTRRKSQATAFLASLFGGIFGIDYFYLGFPLWGVAKLCTLGGLGFWWILDIVRTGAGPVYAHDFRTAHDLPHWVYVLTTITFFGVIGFAVALESYLHYRKAKREDLLKLQQGEESRSMPKPDEMDGPRFRVGAGMAQPSFNPERQYSGYGATLPGPYPNAGAPQAATRGW